MADDVTGRGGGPFGATALPPQPPCRWLGKYCVLFFLLVHHPLPLFLPVDIESTYGDITDSPFYEGEVQPSHADRTGVARRWGVSVRRRMRGFTREEPPLAQRRRRRDAVAFCCFIMLNLPFIISNKQNYKH